MEYAVFGALAAVLALFILKRLLRPSLDGSIQQAVTSANVEPLVALLQSGRPQAQPDAFNLAIRALWDQYERRLAMQVIRAFAEAHPDATIVQYWLAQARSVEPELCGDVLDADFLRGHYRHEVAAACGKAG